MQTLFENVLRASLYGSVIIAALLLGRPLLKKVPKKYLCLLWLLAFARLLMPFEIPFDLSLQPDVTAITQPQAAVRPTIQDLPEPVPAVPENAPMPEDVEVVYGDAFTPSESIPAGLESYYPPAEEVSEPLVINWNAIGFGIWAAVGAGLGLYGIVSLARLKRRVREAVRCRDGVWECAGLETAFILGWVRPKVYLPMGLNADTRHHILRHERAHLQRKDHWLKLLGFLALAVHWFNPLVWAAWVLLCRDMELACDEQVVKDMGLSERKDYSAALLRCSTAKEHYLACPVAFGEVSVKARILSVLNYRRPRFWISLAGIVAILFVAVFFMTSPANPPEELAWAVHLRERNVASIELYCKTEITQSDEVYHRYEGNELPQIIRYINDIDAQVSWEQKDWEPVAALVVTMKDGTVHRLEKSGNIFLTVDDVFCVADADWMERFPRTGNVLAEKEPDLSFLNYKNAISLAAEQKKVMAIYCVDSSICPGEVWGDDLARLLDAADWQERRAVPGDQSSPGSIEFILEEDYRITLFDRKFARVEYAEDVRYYRIPQETYEYAVELLTNPEERILTEEDILIERCQSAMEAIMYADSYHIAVYADLMRTPALQTYYEAEFWKSHENRLSRWYPDSDTATSWRMEWNGTRFKKLDCATWVSPDLQPHDWVEAEFDELDEARNLPWFHVVDWNRHSFTVEHYEVSDDTEEITLRHIERDFDQHAFTMTFLLDKDGKLLRIDRKWVMYQGQACEGIFTTEFISFDEAEVAAEFEQIIESNPAVFLPSYQMEKDELEERARILEQSMLLQRCYDALSWHQVQSSRHTRMHVFLAGDMVTEGEITAEYWHTLPASARKVSREEGSADDGWLVEKNGNLYCKGIKRGYPEDVTDYTIWVEAVDLEENVMTTWLEEYRWDFSQIEFLSSQEQGAHTVIQFRVNEVITDNLGGSADNHVVTFCVNKDNELLWAADNYAILGTLDGDAYGYMVSAEIQILTYDEKTVTQDMEKNLAEIQFPY